MNLILGGSSFNFFPTETIIKVSFESFSKYLQLSGFFLFFFIINITMIILIGIKLLSFYYNIYL